MWESTFFILFLKRFLFYYYVHVNAGAPQGWYRCWKHNFGTLKSNVYPSSVSHVQIHVFTFLKRKRIYASMIRKMSSCGVCWAQSWRLSGQGGLAMKCKRDVSLIYTSFYLRMEFQHRWKSIRNYVRETALPQFVGGLRWWAGGMQRRLKETWRSRSNLARNAELLCLLGI